MNIAIPQMVGWAKTLYRVGDTLRGTGARGKYGECTLTASNFVNVRINEKGTVVCGKNGIVLWNEGEWAEVCGREICPPKCPANASSLFAEVRQSFKPGDVLLAGVGAREGLGAATLTACDLRNISVNGHGNIVAGSVLVWSAKRGWAQTSSGGPISLPAGVEGSIYTELKPIVPPAEVGSSHIPEIRLSKSTRLVV